MTTFSILPVRRLIGSAAQFALDPKSYLDWKPTSPVSPTTACGIAVRQSTDDHSVVWTISVCPHPNYPTSEKVTLVTETVHPEMLKQFPNSVLAVAVEDAELFRQFCSVGGINAAVSQFDGIVSIR